VPDAPRSPRFVGQRIRRKEDERLIQGGGTYVDDIQLPGLLHLGFRRSDLAHARIIRIDTTKAAALPGIEAVFTGVDLRDLPSMPILTPFPAPNFFPLARDKVRYVGEPLAVVVASDRYIARDAIDAIEVELEELPAVVDPELALRGEPAILHEDYPNNLAIPVIFSGTGVDPEASIVDDTAIDDAFAEARVVVSQRMVSPRVAPSPLETRGVVAQYNAGKDFLTLWISTRKSWAWAKTRSASSRRRSAAASAPRRTPTPRVTSPQPSPGAWAGP
jgi:carbon-monoxide dehydrogenase large subunit